MPYHEAKDTSGVAPFHRKAALIAANKKKASDISNAEIRPSDREQPESNVPKGIGYHEPRDPLRDSREMSSRASRMQSEASTGASKQLMKPKPTPVNLFDYESVEDAKVQLKEGLDYPYVGVKSSILGGKEEVSILITVSKDPESEWANHILQNSRYAKIHILRDGTVEQFCGWKLKMRKFKGKSIEHVIEKINKIKVVE